MSRPETGEAEPAKRADGNTVNTARMKSRLRMEQRIIKSYYFTRF
jgi:hypothetical protein